MNLNCTCLVSENMTNLQWVIHFMNWVYQQGIIKYSISQISQVKQISCSFSCPRNTLHNQFQIAKNRIYSYGIFKSQFSKKMSFATAIQSYIPWTINFLNNSFLLQEVLCVITGTVCCIHNYTRMPHNIRLCCNTDIFNVVHTL